MNLNLVTIAALGGLLAFSNLSSAQNTNTNRVTERRFPSVQQRVDRLSTELKLNDDQKAKVSALFEKQAKERREIFGDRALSRDERRDKMRALMEDESKQLKGILTPDQLEKWKTLREQMRSRAPRQPGEQGEPPAAPAPAPAPSTGSK